MIRQTVAADAAAIAVVHVDTWLTTYRGIIPDTYLATLSHERSESFWTKTLDSGEVVYVWDDERDGVVGFASGGSDRSGDSAFRGELYGIYVLASHQRRGIGRQLVRSVVQNLTESGLSSMLVWVVASNPSKSFYEALGGKELYRRQVAIGGASIEEIAYGWDDIAASFPS